MPRTTLVLAFSLIAFMATADGVVSAQTGGGKKARPPTRNSHYARKEFEAKDGSKLVYYLMTPRRYDAKRKYALVLALHGRGGNSTAADILGRDEFREMYPCFVLAPVSPRPFSWASPRGSARGGKTRSLKMPAVIQALEALQEEVAVDADRIYVTGQSMGGFGSFGAVAARPELFAAAVPICGGWAPGEAKAMARVPFWIFHGADDKVVPVSSSQRMVKALKVAGARPKYTEYPGVKHNSWMKAYQSRELWKWMFEQRRPSAPEK